MDDIKNCFGKYLKELIKAAGLTQAEFYTDLGIKKPYFYDIVSGRVNPPPHSLQFKAMKILKADEETKEKFFDLAAKGRGDLPADITKLISDHPSMVKTIRNRKKLLAYDIRELKRRKDSEQSESDCNSRG